MNLDGTYAIDFGLAALLGGLYGAGELISRYRDEPGRAMKTPPALSYIALNAAASTVGLLLVLIYGWTFSTPSTSTPTPPSAAASGLPLRCTRVLLAGFGAMALFRSAFFTIRVSGQDVGVGPIHFLQAALAAVDGAVDRRRGRSRDAIVQNVMKGVSFSKSYQALPAYCLALMQNLPQEDQARFGAQVDAIAKSKMEDATKALLLGLALINLVGEDLTTQAVQSLGASIRA